MSFARCLGRIIAAAALLLEACGGGPGKPDGGAGTGGAAAPDAGGAGGSAAGTGGSGAPGGTSGSGGSGSGGAGGTGGAIGSGGAGGATGSGGRSGSGGATGSGGAGGRSGSGGATGSGGAGGRSGSGGSGGAAATCPGQSLTQDGVLDLDLRAVTVAGTVTLGGAVLPDQGSNRGQITFSAGGGETVISIDLGTTDARTYTLRLPPAIYDIAYVPGAGACPSGTTGSTFLMPCGGGSLRRGLALVADGVLDVDIPVVTVTGQVTLDGQPFPDQSGARGSLGFALSGGGTASTAPFGSSGPVTYRVNLIPGTYDVLFNGITTGCGGSASPAIPCGTGPLRQRIALTANGVLDVDVPAIRVSGTVTLNGARMPDATANRGALTFTSATGTTASTAAFGTAGAVTYTVTLLPGSYAVGLDANAGLCGASLSPEVPCLGGTVLPALALSADGVLDVNIPAVTVTGAVTLGGQTLPTATGERGRLSFTRSDGGGGTLYGLGTTGAGSYRARLLPGTYDIGYAANAGLCAAAPAGAPPPLPCTGGTVGSAIPITADGVFDVDLRRVAVSGAVTLRGAALPAAAGNRGALTFTRADGGGAVTTAAFGATGGVTYGLALWPGVYEVELAANAALCGQGLAAPPVPCIGGAVRSAVRVEADGVLDVDLPAVTVSGTVRLNGAPLPAESAGRGSIGFARSSAEGGGMASVSLGPSGSATYAVTLLPGRYLIRHQANAALCAPAAATPGVPCASQVVFGCTSAP